jgi:hypothetical protein
MHIELISILANFASPEEIGTNSQSMLWLLPLALSIAVVYKATKLPSMNLNSFLKETGELVGSIIVFMAVTAVVLFAVAWLVTQ